jgi:hypothetical protein
MLFTAPGLPPSPAAEMSGEGAQPDYTVSTLREALDIIGREVAKRTVPTIATHPNPAPRSGERRPADPASHVPGAASPDTLTTNETAHSQQSREDDPVVVPRELPAPIVPAAAPGVEDTSMPEKPAVPAELVTEDATVPSVVPHVAEAEPPARPEPAEAPRVEALLQEILAELRRRSDDGAPDFSVSKMIAGITQIIAIALMFIAYLNRTDNGIGVPLLIFAIFFQNLTIALLIMGRQR